MTDATLEKIHALSAAGILSAARTGHVLECHFDGKAIEKCSLKSVMAFTRAWLHLGDLLPELHGDLSYVALTGADELYVAEYVTGGDL
jgi:hypothetical protein